MSKGYVYILSNPSMPGLVKIGKTTRSVAGRANELYQTGVPTPFRVEYEVLSPNCDWLERETHSHFSEVRVDPGREFFRSEGATVSKILDCLLRQQVEAWLEEFIPDQVIVDADYFIDPSGLSITALEAIRHHDIAPPDVAQVIYQIAGDEIEPAINRFIKIRDERVRAYRQEKLLRVVGDK